MSPTQSEITNGTPAIAIALLKEYTEKLNRLAGRLREARQEHTTSRGKSDARAEVLRTEFESSRDYVQKLRPAVEELFRHISQLHDHSGLDLLRSIELNLRLSELEVALRAAEREAHSPDTFF
jgi:hypothetical protein